MGLKKISVRGEVYSLILLKVEERDFHGRPSKVTVGYDDTTFKLDGGEEFITAFVPEATVKRKATA